MIVVIDPGHGGTKEVGGSSPNNAVGPTGLLEKDVVLTIALLTRDILVADGVTCIMTRATDQNLGLRDRAAVAKTAAADAFVSIHFNGLDGVIQGTETFAHTNAGAASKALRKAVQEGVLKATGLRNRQNQSGNFTVINPIHHDGKTAACLCEVSFMDVPAEEARLKTDAYRKKIATELAAAIKTYLDNADKSNPEPLALEGLDPKVGDDFEDGFSALNQV